MKSNKMITGLTRRQKVFFANLFSIKCTLILGLLLILIGNKVQAQESVPMQVIRCDAIDQRSPIINVYVDEANNKWVATSKELFQVKALDLASVQKLSVGEQSVLNLPNGNQDFRFSKESLSAIIGSENLITTAFFDKKKEELWIGTEDAGAFQLKTKPSLQLLNKFNNSSSKMKSNFVNTIFIDHTGEVWIGTEEGVLVGKGGRWSLEEKLVSFNRVTEDESYVWLLGNGFIWKVNGRGDWIPVEIDPKKLDGAARDIALDSLGRIWIASEIMTVFDPGIREYQVFGPIQYFTSQYATCMAVDKDGAVWVGTEDKGLYLIEKASAMTVNALVEKELGCDVAKNDAAIRIKITGGKAPYTYAWTNGLQGENPKNLGPGEYTVTVTDSEGKTKSAQVAVLNPRFNVQVAQDKIESAPNAGDGVASVTIVGNATEFTFKWDNGETTKTAKKLTNGNHSVTVTDKKGCSATGTVTIGQQSAALAVSIEQVSGITCANEKNAALKVVVTGGKAPFQYQWNDPKLSGDQLQGLGAGNYNLKVTDAEGQNMSAFVTIPAPEPLVATAQVQAPASTGNADGKALANVKGGNGNYTFKWDNSETSATAVKLAPGKHIVTITDSNGCNTTTSIEVLENVLPLAVNLTEKTSIKCAGTNEAAITAQVTGGKAPFQYQWSDAKLSGESPSGIAAGTYQVTITDAVGTKTNASITIKAPEAIAVNIQAQAPASTGNADGKALANVKGGNGNYTFKWDNNETSATAAKLAPGKHTVTVTDANGCSATASIDITENILPLAVSIQEKNAIKCAGTSEASVLAQVTGGKSPFQYQWSDAKLSGESPSGIAAGTYQVTITDAVGTKTNASITIKAPEAIAVNIQAQAPASTGNADGKALANVKGGNGNYTFKWDNSETSATAAKLAPGKHTVTVTDANGCSATASIEITENILPLAVSIQEKNAIKCAGTSEASVLAQVTGGKAPFQYQWSDAKLSGESPSGIAAGTYQVTITDAVGTKTNASITIKAPEAIAVNIQAQAPASTGNADGKALANVKGGNGNYTFKWDNNETSATAAKLAPGKHTVTVTDANGCSATASIEITENILPLAVSIQEKNAIKCAGTSEASVLAQVTGGKAPFQYQWSDAKLSGESPSGIAAGTYQVTITDAVGTKTNASITIKAPEAIAVNIQAQAPASTGNADGKALANVKGGNGNYTFKWDNSETSATAVKLAPGKHTVTVTDANGCSATASIEITENILPLTVSIAEKAKIRCADAKEGALQVQVSGGKAPFQYQWSAAGISGEQVSGLAAGTYNVTVTDVTGATKTATISLAQPTMLTAEISDTKMATSASVLDGKASVTAKGGSGIYTYQWSNGETSANATKLSPGNNTVTVTDANGCTAVVNFEIGQRILAALSGTVKSGQTIRMEQLQFEADSSTINEPSLPVLNELYDFLQENTSIFIEVGGHTNSLPPDEVCDRLSTARAKSVVEYLVEKGINEGRLSYKGYGKRVPIADNGTPEGRQQNQRVEIKILRVGRPKESGG